MLTCLHLEWIGEARAATQTEALKRVCVTCHERLLWREGYCLGKALSGVAERL